jgi:hypothetical protein
VREGRGEERGRIVTYYMKIGISHFGERIIRKGEKTRIKK